ncbi:ANK_REP_REGION domain-containing protein [Gammaproteobacteria bacterium]
MSLSKKIIYGSDQEVANIIKSKHELDVIDEYGYTPLIQTAIINSTAKAKILLDAGAKVDFQDLTGRTALFWAADNNNLELSQLCLKHGANPNAYSSGAQPVLVMPLMKKQQDVKKLLTSFGAKLDFAQDFLNAKLLGHSFELEGRVDIVDTNNTFIEVELEGFYLRFTLEIIANSLHNFRNNFGAKKLRKYFPKLDIIMHALQTAIDLIQLQNYLIDIDHFLNKINSLLEKDPLILPISFGGHAITLIKYHDWFIRCDRGEYGVEHGTVIYYEMQYPTRLTKTLCRELLYKRQHPEFINVGLANHLGLQPKSTLPLPVQKTGNCSWANAEAVVPALMFLLLHEGSDNKPKNCEQEAMYFYNEWVEWDKSRSLDFCLQGLNSTDPARRAAKVALLTAILFQSCNYNNQNDRNKANKILAVLKQPEYMPILKCYAKSFSQDSDNMLWKNFSSYLEDFGIDMDALLSKI